MQNLQTNSSLWNCNAIWTYPALFTNTTRQVYSKATRTIFNYIDAPSFKKSFTQRRLKVKSKDYRSALPNWKDSRPSGINLALTSSKMTSSEARAQPLGGGLAGSGPPPPIWTDHPNFLRSCMLQCTKLSIPSAFVLYNNQDQGIGPPTLKTWLRPCSEASVT